jgi:hypothetical protein
MHLRPPEIPTHRPLQSRHPQNLKHHRPHGQRLQPARLLEQHPLLKVPVREKVQVREKVTIEAFSQAAFSKAWS